MKITFLSLFPNYFKPFVEESIVQKAIVKQLLEVEIKDIRTFSKDKHQRVDDKVYGGGKGMLLQVEPVHAAIQSTQGHVILVTPQGKILTQKRANELAKLTSIVLVSGRYEGFDERITHFVDEEISIGDYVLSGGELPAMVIADCVARLVPGVIQEESHQNDSFQNYLLDFPQYTRPREYLGHQVPEVILNGNHAEIERWRHEQQILKTQKNRPDLLTKFERQKHAK